MMSHESLCRLIAGIANYLDDNKVIPTIAEAAEVLQLYYSKKEELESVEDEPDDFFEDKAGE